MGYAGFSEKKFWPRRPHAVSRARRGDLAFGMREDRTGHAASLTLVLIVRKKMSTSFHSDLLP
jgi:hypothetical protein